jgi:hypothetical protein
MDGNKPMILKAIPKTSSIVKFLALLSEAWLESGNQDLPSQLLLIAKRREHGGIILAREALINSIMGSAARSLLWIWK